MKLSKSPAGKALIILYYAVFVAVDVIVMLLIMHITGSFWPAFGVSFVLGIGIGILGGELEFREHCKTRYREHHGRQEAEESKIIDFRAAPGD